jgi:hypothetical protein
MGRTDIFKTEFQARRHAKYFFAGILNISPKSVIVAHDKYYESKYGSTTCVCGETMCHYFMMKNAGPFQLKKLEAAIDRPGAVIALGTCKACGQSF